jgi:regulator of protease activity HflC (stomatin/prohibitin superfamily)
MAYIVISIVCAVAFAAGLVVRRVRLFMPAAAFVVWGIATLVASIITVSPGMVAVADLFGKVQSETYGEGLHLINPLYTTRQMTIRRQSLHFTSTSRDGKSVTALSADRNPLEIDVSFPFRLNGGVAWKIYQRVGGTGYYRGQLIFPSARSAVRDAVSQFPWAEASIEKLPEVAALMQEKFENRLIQDLIKVGFTEPEARTAFSIMPVQLRKILPDAKVRNAIAERVAAEEDLKRQVVLTKIAKQEAERRANEGLGVKKLFAELPKDFNAGEIRQVLSAISEKVRADAIMKAVENERIQTLVITGSAPVSIPVK